VNESSFWAKCVAAKNSQISKSNIFNGSGKDAKGAKKKFYGAVDEKK
jgi:hypothetical protein